MPTTVTADWQEVAWSWTEAFSKHGFGDGDGLVMTDKVARAIRELGYTVEHSVWGSHNDTIDTITKADGTQVYPPPRHPKYQPGYDNPRYVLPRRIVTHLDTTFPDPPCWP